MLLEDLYKQYGKLNGKKKLRRMSRNIYAESSKPHVCNICGFSEYVEIHHIKPLCEFNLSDPIADIVNIDNLEALCPNCHAIVHSRECR